MNDNKKLNKVKIIREQHSIWKNPLLKACKEGKLTFEDFQYIFSQYYLYSKNFSRLLAAIMVNCENDLFRSKLAENLWEESGEKVLEKRHAEIFRQFLLNTLKINSLDEIQFEMFTEIFVEEYLKLSLDSPPLEAVAALSLGTEGIVSKLYLIFREGLIAAGIPEDELNFFNIHIACDDAHAETLEEILLDYTKEDPNLIRTTMAMQHALDLRDVFFNHLYQEILNRRVIAITKNISQKPCVTPDYNYESLKSSISLDSNFLYSNNDTSADINFSVKRIPFSADVLDPRIVKIPSGQSNENHQHAHETILLFLKGVGEVIIDNKIISVKEGDVVHVPRWVMHQTRNSGEMDLSFFAVTDYGLTRRIPSNSEEVYRYRKENVVAS